MPGINMLTVGAQINHLAAEGVLARIGKKRISGCSRPEMVFKYQKHPPKVSLRASKRQLEEARRQASEINPKNRRLAFLARAEMCEVMAVFPIDFMLGTSKALMIGKADRVIALWQQVRSKLEAMR